MHASVLIDKLERTALDTCKRALSIKLASFCNRRLAVVYFSPRLLCRFDLAVRAISIRWRIASEREGAALDAFSSENFDWQGFRTAVYLASGGNFVVPGGYNY
jgi:hypothetical protein